MSHRNFIKKIVCLLAVVILLYECNKGKLNQPALGVLNQSQLANKTGVEGLLIGAYALLDGQSYDNQPGGIGNWASAASNWIYGSICGSEAHPGSYFNDPANSALIPIETFNIGSASTNFYLDIKWIAVYAGVNRANLVLNTMRLAKDLSPSDTVEIRAEALFLRAFFHFEAKKMWNRIPFIDENVTYDAGNYHVANDTSWGLIENDFRYAADNLPQSQGGAVGRANKYAAEAFLAKVYMFEHKYAEAKPLLQDLITNGMTAGGIPYALGNYEYNFNPDFKNGSESVFSVQSSVDDGASGQNGNPGDVLNFPMGGPGVCCGFYQPTQWLVNHFKTDPVTGLPDLYHFNDVDLKSDIGYGADSIFIPDTGTLDPRLDWSAGRRGVPYLDWGPHPGQLWIRDANFSFGPYDPKKNTFYKSQISRVTDQSAWTTGLTADNVNLIRFADILLWAAEVEVEIGSLDQAQIYVNKVRSRAADSTGWVTNNDNLAYAKAVTNSQAEFNVIDDPAYTGINPFDWVVRQDLNQTWVAIKVNQDGSKVWNPYSPPNYKIGLYTIPWTNRDSALKAIRYERVLELAMEGHRFFDLVRWGIADQEINTYLPKESNICQYFNGVSFTKGVNEYFAIPLNEINLSAGADGKKMMVQNPGY
jgi:hypothetical protein